MGIIWLLFVRAIGFTSWTSQPIPSGLVCDPQYHLALIALKYPIPWSRDSEPSNFLGFFYYRILVFFLKFLFVVGILVQCEQGFNFSLVVGFITQECVQSLIFLLNSCFWCVRFFCVVLIALGINLIMDDKFWHILLWILIACFAWANTNVMWNDRQFRHLIYLSTKPKWV